MNDNERIIEALKEEKADFREILKNLVLFIITTISGSLIILYKSLNGDFKTDIMIFSYIGFILTIALIGGMVFVLSRMGELTKEIRNIE